MVVKACFDTCPKLYFCTSCIFWGSFAAATEHYFDVFLIDRWFNHFTKKGLDPKERFQLLSVQTLYFGYNIANHFLTHTRKLHHILLSEYSPSLTTSSGRRLRVLPIGWRWWYSEHFFLLVIRWWIYKTGYYFVGILFNLLLRLSTCEFGFC